MVVQLLKEGKTDQAAQKARVLLAKEAIAKQMDQAADMAELSVAQIQANNATKRMTAMMAQSSKTMSRAQKQMNPEKVRLRIQSLFQNRQEHHVCGIGLC